MDIKLLDFDEVAAMTFINMTMSDAKALFSIMAITNTKDVNEKIKEKFGEEMESEVLEAISYMRKDLVKFVGSKILNMDKELLETWYKKED